MLQLSIKETPYDRRVAFKGRDFVVVMAERGWHHFHSTTPEMKKNDNSVSEQAFVNLIPFILEKYQQKLLNTFNKCKPCYGDSLNVSYNLDLKL